jgi:VCBS repeat protein/leishmanolysin
MSATNRTAAPQAAQLLNTDLLQTASVADDAIVFGLASAPVVAAAAPVDSAGDITPTASRVEQPADTSVEPVAEVAPPTPRHGIVLPSSIVVGADPLVVMQVAAAAPSTTETTFDLTSDFGEDLNFTTFLIASAAAPASAPAFSPAPEQAGLMLTSNRAAIDTPSADASGGSTSTSTSETASLNTTFDIVIHYSGNPTYQSLFDAAAVRWEQIITADIPDFAGVDDLEIDARVISIDGSGGILGQAGWDFRRPTSMGGLPYQGGMDFDSADVGSLFANGTFDEVILHEMGHILGIGTLWSEFGLKSGFNYTGQHALDEYRTLTGDPSKTFVPLENTGGSGTAGAHWSEAVFNNELMTGFIEASGVSMPLSRLTIASLWDLGYTVNLGAADPYTLPNGPPPPPPPPPPPETAGDTSTLSRAYLGSSIIANLEAAGDHDWFRIELNQGVTYTFAELSGTLGNPLLSLRDVNGQLIAQNDDSGGSVNSQLSFTPATSGTFYLDAGASGDNLTGNYLLTVTAAPNVAGAAAQTHLRDFNGDGNADILWRHLNGTANVFLMNGSFVIGGSNTTLQVDNNWADQSPADFNGDGRGDILWRATNGTANVFLMDGAFVIGGSNTTTQVDNNWRLQDTADFNGDGNADILWRHANGTTNVFLMNGAFVIGGSNTTQSMDTSWALQDTGDFNGDGRADILWRHTDGTARIFLMDGVNVIGVGDTSLQIDNHWHIEGVADFNADGKDDILWRHTNGTANVMLMNGTTVVGGSNTTLQVDTSWHLEGVGDMNGDGNADILWRHANGTANVFLMNGATVIGGSNTTLQVDNDWHVV